MLPSLNSPVWQMFWFDHHRRSQEVSQPRTLPRGCVYIYVGTGEEINLSVCVFLLDSEVVSPTTKLGKL